MKSLPIRGLVCATVVLGLSGAVVAQGYDAYVDRTAMLDEIIADADLWNGGLDGAGGMGVYDGPMSYDPSFDGRFYCHLEQDFSPKTNNGGKIITPISQSRSTYYNVEADRAAVSRGDLLAARFLDAARAGADHLAGAEMWDATYDGYVWAIEHDDADVRNDSKNSYGQVHPIFALAHAYTVTGDSTHLDAALRGMDTFVREASPGEPTGAYEGNASRDWTGDGRRNLDYMCHSFESWFALYEALPAGHARKGEVWGMVEDTGNHIMNTMVQQMQDPGNEDKAFIPWNYESDWTPAMGDPDPQNWWGGGDWRYVSPGHNFEYAFLFSRAIELGDPAFGQSATAADWLEKSEKLINYALEYAFGDVGDAAADPTDPYMAVLYDRVDFGVDSNQGVPIIRENNDGSQRIPTLTWWPQAEAARCLAHWAQRRGKTEWWDEFQGVYALIDEKLIDQTYGGWYYSLDPNSLEPVNDTGGAKLDKASEWKVNYHSTMMNTELARLPEPAAMSLLAIGSLAVLLRPRRRRA